MKKILFTLLLSSIAFTNFAAEISRMEPTFWWTGMKNPELQIMFYGKNIGRSTLQFEYQGVRLKETVRPENPNYLFIYLEISKEAKAGEIQFKFTEGKKTFTQNYELKSRSSSVGAQGFSQSDVLYLIMPDRFANGNPDNDVWDNEAIDRKEPFARHGGDLAGIQKHIDYLDDLGVTAIWLNPVLENKMNSPEKYKSYHGYAVTDFYQVDRRLGSNEEYRLLIENIHQKGMKIVMDMIYNHCGSMHWWMNDLPYKDWLNHQEGFVPTTHNLLTITDVHAPQSEIDAMTNGWFVTSMPDLNQRNPHLATYLIQNSIWWIEYARIDGIRHDTHPYADYDFLSRWCKAVVEEYPDFNIVGESWYANSAPLAWWQANSKQSVKQSNLKTVMDFNLMGAVNQALTVKSDNINPFRQIYEVLAMDFLYADLNNILIFLDNHDTSRFFKKDEADLERYKQALALILTTRGIPQIYYGTEILMYGEKNEGDGLLRKDFPGGWQDDTVDAFTPSGRTSQQNEAWNYLRKILQWRKTCKAVTEGRLIHYAPTNEESCYVYARIADNGKVMVILNGSKDTQTLYTEKYREVIGNATQGQDIISGKTINLSEKITVSPKGVLVIEY
ncbi:MAG: glycoside hydrolase family 13 protein [Dysgonamonadaceae bacterium]|jgi:glycosidase|nr:glycoside hydrolase family 13 protein [Dysgonamonadaceae bacterium]